MRFRAALFCVLIALPALLTIGAGAAYVALNVPGWIRAESGRITREYRETAEELLSDPGRAEESGPRKKGWRQVGRIGGRPWGYVEGAERTVVWVRAEPDVWRSAGVGRIRPVPYALVFYWGGAVVAAILAGLTVLAIWYFLRFLRERDDFLAATAHDLTTPLVGLRMCIGRSEEDARMLVERLLLLVGNIKDFLKLGGRRRPAAEKIDLAALAREAYGLFAADFRDLFDGADVAIRADGPVFARGDETMTLQILWNLFGNDLKYAAPCGSVEVQLRSAGGSAFVDFVDSGPGMSCKEMRRAFDRYYRAKTVLVSGKGGFGIGLCTAREFARSMGGDLTVRANPPHGCVFSLRLPSVG